MVITIFARRDIPHRGNVSLPGVYIDLGILLLFQPLFKTASLVIPVDAAGLGNESGGMPGNLARNSPGMRRKARCMAGRNDRATIKIDSRNIARLKITPSLEITD